MLSGNCRVGFPVRHDSHYLHNTTEFIFFARISKIFFDIVRLEDLFMSSSWLSVLYSIMSIKYGSLISQIPAPHASVSCSHEPKVVRGLCSKCYQAERRKPTFRPWAFGRKFKGVYNTKTARRYLITLLGGKCSNPKCMWLNEDGTRGCIDTRCLQVDHKFGNGNQIKVAAGSAYHDYKNAIADPNRDEHYQCLCANCNWIKRVEREEWVP